MRWAIIDTGVYIDHWERGAYVDLLEDVRRGFIVRHSSVVLSELRRGARTREGRRLVQGLYRLAREPWTPAGSDWWQAGSLIQEIGDAREWDRHKRRDFQNDALIALTARRHGATIVTANGTDFGILSKRLRVAMLPVSEN